MLQTARSCARAGMRARLEVKEQFSIAEEGKNQAGAAAVAGPYYITGGQTSVRTLPRPAALLAS